MDLLVKLYELPSISELIISLSEKGISIRRARAYEKSHVLEWVEKTFSQGWRDECDVAFSRQPIATFIAVKAGQVIGFGSYDATQGNFYGPIGVASSYREIGIGKALVVSGLAAMRELGYAYAIVGGPKDAVPAYKKWVGAIEIEGSEPGIYVSRLMNSDS